MKVSLSFKFHIVFVEMYSNDQTFVKEPILNEKGQLINFQLLLYSVKKIATTGNCQLA
jgi:hypothetical protein